MATGGWSSEDDARTDHDTSKAIKILAQIESAAADVLSDRAQIVELDKKRQDCRMACRQLKSGRNKNKTWMALGKTLFRFPTTFVLSSLESNQKTIDKEIKQIRDNLSTKVNRLYDLEGSAPLNPGFDLKPMSSDECSAMNSLLKPAF